MIDIYRYIRGYVQLEIVCAQTGKLLSLCAKSGINMWNIQHIDGVTLRICIYESQYTDFCEIADTLNTCVKIIKSTGLVCKLKILKSRKFFAAGFLLFILCIFLSTSFVTDVYISGNETVSDGKILSLLDEAGFSVGTFVHNINYKDIQQKVLLKSNKLSWLWIHLVGTKAYVEVKETTPKPQITDSTDYSNCVAAADGIITEVMPRYGKQIVFPGDVVKKGDLLISGISETKASGTRYLHADGIVTAKTWYSVCGEYNHTKEVRNRTGKFKRAYTLNIDGVSMPVGRQNNCSFEEYDTEYTVKKISNILNLSFTICTYYEIIKEDITIDDNEAVNSAVNVLTNILKIQIYCNDAYINSLEHSYYINQSGNVCVTVAADCTQNIAQYMPLEKPDIYTEESDGKNSDV